MFYVRTTFYDETDEEVVVESKLVAASTFAEAVETVTHYYGEDNVLDMRLKFLTEDRMLDVDDDNQDELIIRIEGLNN